MQNRVAGFQASGLTEAARAKSAETALQTTLNTEIARAQAADTALQTALDNKAARKLGDAATLASSNAYTDQVVTPVAAKLTFVNVSGGEMYITGTNLHIQSGSGATDDNGNLTGLGNLIVGSSHAGFGGYIPRTGSHNLILGDRNSYTSFGGIVAGFSSRILGPYCTITSGVDNTASDSWSSVNGGFSNRATGQGSNANGGQQNIAYGIYAVVSGGKGNVVNTSNGWAGGSYLHPDSD